MLRTYREFLFYFSFIPSMPTISEQLSDFLTHLWQPSLHPSAIPRMKVTCVSAFGFYFIRFNCILCSLMYLRRL